MKKKLLLLFILFSLNFFSQNNNQGISIEINDLDKKKIIALIEQKTNYSFYFLEKWLDSKKVTKTFKNANIKNILDFLVEDSSLNYFITNDYKIILTYGNLIHKSAYENEITHEEKDTIVKEKTFVYPSKIIIDTNNKLVKIGKETQGLKQKSYTLSGIITNRKTGEPIEGVVILERSKNISTTTNNKGYYKLNLPYGKHNIEAILVGFTKINKPIIVYNNGKLNFSISENSEQLDEVVVNANKSNNIKQTISGITELKAEEIKTIPLVLGERDILKVATTLPGIKSAGEGAEGINVRGGKIDQNLFLLDNGVIYNPTHFLGLFSAINPFTTKNLKVFKGNIPAEYGGRISSVFDIKSKDASTKKFKGEASIGPVTGNLSVEIPIVKDKSGLILGVRSTYSDWLLQALNDKKLSKSSVSFFDVIAKYNHQINKNNTIRLSAYYSKDKYQIASDTTNYYGNTMGAINWEHKFNKKNTGNLIFSSSQYTFNTEYNSNGNSNFNLKYTINESELKLKMKYLHSSKHILNYGIASKLYNVSPGSIAPNDDASSVTPLTIANEKGLESAAFISDNFKVNKQLSFDIGLRFSNYLALGASTQRFYEDGLPKNNATLAYTKEYDNNEVIKSYQGLSYRLSGRYLINDQLSLKGGFNKSFQYIHRLSNTTTASPIDTWRLSDSNIKPQEGTQISLGLFQNLNDDAYEISLEGYYKKYKNLVDYKVGASLLLNETIETEILQGDGKSYGIEFLIKKKFGRLNGWLGYSYSKSLIQLDGDNPEETVNNGVYFPTNYDKPHDFNAILNYKLTKRYSLSSNFVFQSGRPVTYPTGKYIYQGTEYLLYSDRNKFRIPNYYRLDIGLNIEGNHKIKKFAHSFWNISVYNVLGINNPYSVYFETTNGKVTAYKSSIFSIPVPTITYNFKF